MARSALLEHAVRSVPDGLGYPLGHLGLHRLCFRFGLFFFPTWLLIEDDLPTLQGPSQLLFELQFDHPLEGSALLGLPQLVAERELARLVFAVLAPTVMASLEPTFAEVGSTRVASSEGLLVVH